MRQIWAVTRHMVAQGVRMRVAMVVILIFVVLTPSLPFVLKGDGTLEGLVQVVVTYSLVLATILLSVLTLALSTASLCGEVRDKQLFILDTKPIARWQILAGKWAGIMLINLALLAFMGGCTYGLMRYVAGQQGDMDDETFRVVKQGLSENVLCARRSVQPRKPDLDELVDETLRREMAAKNIPEGMSEKQARPRLRKVIRGHLQSVPYGYGKTWRFDNVPQPPPGRDHLSIRFQYNAASGFDKNNIDCLWLVGSSAQQGTLQIRNRHRIASFHEFRVPASVVPADGSVFVRFENQDEAQGVLSFALEDGIELLVYVGGFGANFVRGLTIMALKLGFLAAAGLFCSTFLTLPVAVTLASCIYLLTGMSGFIAEVAEQPWTMPHQEGTGGEEVAKPPWFEGILTVLLKSIRVVFPPLEEFSVVSKLNAGREVAWRAVAKAVGIVLLLRGGVLALLGCYLFRRRELAGLDA